MPALGRMFLNGLGRSNRRTNSRHIILLALFICVHANANNPLENADEANVWYNAAPQSPEARIPPVPPDPCLSRFPPAYARAACLIPSVQGAWQMPFNGFRSASQQFQPTSYPNGYLQTFPATNPQPSHNLLISPFQLSTAISPSFFTTQMDAAQLQANPQSIINSPYQQIPPPVPHRMYSFPSTFPPAYRFPPIVNPYQQQYQQIVDPYHPQYTRSQQLQYRQQRPQSQYHHRLSHPQFPTELLQLKPDPHKTPSLQSPHLKIPKLSLPPTRTPHPKADKAKHHRTKRTHSRRKAHHPKVHRAKHHRTKRTHSRRKTVIFDANFLKTLIKMNGWWEGWNDILSSGVPNAKARRNRLRELETSTQSSAGIQTTQITPQNVITLKVVKNKKASGSRRAVPNVKVVPTKSSVSNGQNEVNIKLLLPKRSLVVRKNS